MTLPLSEGSAAVTYGGGKFVALSYVSNLVAYSTNGTSWSTATLPDGNSRNTVAYGNNRFVTSDAYSLDGITWVKTNNNYYYMHKIVYGKEKFVCVGNSGFVLYSLDGETWVKVKTPYSDPIYCLSYNDDIFVIINKIGRIMYSEDGIVWKDYYKAILQNNKHITNSITDLILDENAIPVPSTAEVGQTIVVKAVDENGKPTEWEAVDAWTISSSTEGSTKKFKLTIDDSGVLTATEIVESEA